MIPLLALLLVATPPRIQKDDLAAGLPQIKSALKLAVEQKKFPSLVFGIVTDSGLVWSEGFGATKPTAETVFRVGSVTKVFTGLALLQLRDEGKLSLDDPAVNYLPELAGIAAPTTDSPPITLRHLVTHTSGLPRVGNLDYTAGVAPVTEAQVLAALKGVTLDFSPGSRTVYSNLAMGLAGLVVSRVAKMPYRDFVTKRTLVPLGMTASVWEAAQVSKGRLAPGQVRESGAFKPSKVEWKLGAVESAGGLYSSLRDLSAFAAFQLSAWPARDGAEAVPLKRSSLRESQLAAGHASMGRKAFGVNWAVLEDKDLGYQIFHNGSTDDYSATLYALPQRGIAVIALVNGGEAPELDALVRAQLVTIVDALPREKGPAEVAFARFKALWVKVDQASVAAAYSPAFLKQIPAPQIVAFIEGARGQLGAIKSEKVIRADGPGRLIVRLECEKGAADLTVDANPAPPHLIEGLLLTPAK